MKKLILLSVCAIFMSASIFAQEETTTSEKTDSVAHEIENLKGHIDGLNEILTEVKNSVDGLKKLKVSGYVQTQYQTAQQDGIKSLAGGNFGANMHNRFSVRRGRVKFDYKNTFNDYAINQFVVQIDITEKGLGVKDAYLRLNEQWFKSFSLTAGVFDRPFGFEIGYSSSQRETPERSRVFQSLFPGERDLGLKLEFLPEELSPLEDLKFMNIKAGIFAGNGINPETDNYKDFIGRLGFTFPSYELNLSLDFGFSGYLGNVSVPTGKKYITDNITKAQLVTTEKFAERKYFGADFQLYYDLPLLGGMSLRGEYLTGKQPGTSSANTSFTALPTGDIYERNFNGYYLLYLQNLGESNQFVVKYDVYDPNTDAEGDEIGKNADAKLGAADLKYSTLGLGLIHHWDENIKFVFYYDMVKNEVTKNLKDYSSELKQDVFTIRLQYKF